MGLASERRKEVQRVFRAYRRQLLECESYYDALQTSLRKRMAHDLQAQASYNFGKSLDTGSDVLPTTSSTRASAIPSPPGVPPPDLADWSYKLDKSKNPPEWAWWEYNVDDFTAGKGKLIQSIVDATDPDLTRWSTITANSFSITAGATEDRRRRRPILLSGSE